MTGAIACALVAPVVVPYCIYICIRAFRQEQAMLRRVLRTHREHVFQPLHLAHLPEIARSYFDELTPKLIALGFSSQGTFILKPGPVQLVGRCFSGPDGRAIAVLGENCDTPHLSFTTLFENGCVLETTSTDVPAAILEINQTAWYRAIPFPDATVAEAYARHLKEIDILEKSRGAPALALCEDQFREVLTYEGRVFSREMFAMGKKDAPPPEPILPTPHPPDETPRGDPEFVTTDVY